jgi:hypothetical protein
LCGEIRRQEGKARPDPLVGFSAGFWGHWTTPLPSQGIWRLLGIRSKAKGENLGGRDRAPILKCLSFPPPLDSKGTRFAQPG